MKQLVHSQALELGFSHVGFCRADRYPGDESHLETWLEKQFHGSMQYLARNAAARANPRSLLPSARSIVVLAAPYPRADKDDSVAAYARVRDYHREMSGRLEQLLDFIRSNQQDAEGIVCVDTKPLLERAAAARAGIGWIGKNTMVLNEDLGPWFLLGELVTSVEFEPDPPKKDRCGTCTRCLDDCPTNAFVAPYVLDSRRCLSYWSIEHRGASPEWIREANGTRIFGCDDCLVTCPFGTPVDEQGERVLPVADELRNLEPERVIEMVEDGFNRNFKQFAMSRAGKAGLLRNCLTALGNSGVPAKAATVRRYLRHDDPGVRIHAAWALGRLDFEAARTEIEDALQVEEDPDVRDEQELILNRLREPTT